MFSVGIGVSLYANYSNTDFVNPLHALPGEESLISTKETRFVPAVTLGLLLQNRDSSLIYDIYGGYAFDNRVLIDSINFPVNGGDEQYVILPLFVEHTLTFALNGRNTFFVVKQMNNVYFDTGYFYGRLMCLGSA